MTLAFILVASSASRIFICTSFTDCLCFRFVSPSRFFVSMQHRPDQFDDFIRMRSAGKYSSDLTMTTSPTFRFLHLSSTKYFLVLFLSATERTALITCLEFSTPSARWRFMSSKMSFKPDTIITNNKGTRIVGYPFVIEIGGITYKHYISSLYLQYGHYKEVNIGKFRELINKVLRQEGDHTILRGLDLVPTEHFGIFLRLVQIEHSQRFRTLVGVSRIVHLAMRHSFATHVAHIAVNSFVF